MSELKDFAHTFKAARDAEALQRELATVRTSFKRKVDVFSSQKAHTTHGDVVVSNIEKLLDSFKGYTRTPEQKGFHRAMVNASLPHFFGGEAWSRCQARVLRDREVSVFQSEVLICCPRRIGKTTSVSMFIAAVLYCAPKIVIGCFSPGQRASTTLLQQTADFVLSLPDGKSRILKQNQEELVLRSADGREKCTFKSFPSSISGLRGQGGNIIILEEASQIKPALFNQVVIPLMGVNYTAAIGISTPLEASNYFSKLLVAKKPNGLPLFHTITIERLCPACRARKVLVCPHSTTQPPWKSDEREEMVRTMLADNPEVYMREQLGIVTNSNVPAFDQAGVAKAWGARPSLASLAMLNNTMYMAIDPAGGGGSGFAVVTCFTEATSRATVVCSADASRVEDEAELRSYLVRHVSALRQVPAYACCKIVVIIERNFGGSVMASMIGALLTDFQPLEIMSGDTTKHRRVGVVTTALVKEKARLDLDCALKLGSLAIIRREDFVSLDVNSAEKLHREMQAFSFCKEEKNGREVTVLTGKSCGGNDDLIIALLLNMFWTVFVISNGAQCYTR